MPWLLFAPVAIAALPADLDGLVALGLPAPWTIWRTRQLRRGTLAASLSKAEA